MDATGCGLLKTLRLLKNMQDTDISTLTMESAAAALLLAVAWKLWRLKCHSESKCCGDKLHFDASNPGVTSDGLA